MKPEPLVFEGALFMSAFNPIVSQYSIYQNFPVHMFPKNSSIQLYNTMIYIPTMLQNTVGLDFMKRFDWVIDYKSKKVYVRPLPGSAYNDKEIDLNSKKYGVSIIDDGLQIIFRRKGLNQFPLFKNISRINGTLVDRSNLAALSDTLNNDSTWNNNHLEFED